MPNKGSLAAWGFDLHLVGGLGLGGGSGPRGLVLEERVMGI